MSSKHEHGREIMDPVPYAATVDTPEETTDDRIRQLLYSEKMQTLAEARGMETAEEAEDFDIPDDIDDPTTPYEVAPFLDEVLKMNEDPDEVPEPLVGPGGTAKQEAQPTPAEQKPSSPEQMD